MDPLEIIFVGSLLINVGFLLALAYNRCFGSTVEDSLPDRRSGKKEIDDPRNFNNQWRQGNRGLARQAYSIELPHAQSDWGLSCKDCQRNQLWFFPQNLSLCHNLKKEFCSLVKHRCDYLHYEDCTITKRRKSSLFQLVEVLESAKKEILICVFAITSIPLARILIQMKKKIPTIRVITDAKNLTDDNSRVPDFIEAGIEVKKNRIDDALKGRNKFMHHKFAVIDEKVLIHGSFNWSHFAANVQYELLAKTEQLDQVVMCREEFKKMWQSRDFVDVELPIMMSSAPPVPPNSKRFWGEEKNIDSIYSIYLKKITYTQNCDVPTSPALRGHNYIDIDNASISTSASSNDLDRSTNSTTLQNVRQHKHLDSDSNCQSKESSPRRKRNFFQKYRRRSCSVDKYSLDKHHQKSASTVTTPVIKRDPKSLRATQSCKKAGQVGSNNYYDTNNHDELDGFQPGHLLNETNLQSSMHELSTTPSQSLQWETRQIKVLQAATLDHVLKFILLINSKNLNNISTNDQDPLFEDSALEEERNSVAHIIHVLFCTYRIYTNPYELMLKIMDYSDICRREQYRFVMHYWMDSYPEDFDYIVEYPENSISDANHEKDATSIVNPQSLTSHNNSMTSYDSSTTTRTAATTDSENSALGQSLNGAAGSGSQCGSDNLDKDLSNLSIKTSDTGKSGVPLVNELLRLCRDEYIRKKAMVLNEFRNDTKALNPESSKRNRHSSAHATISSPSKNSAILDMDSRYVAQQLTAIDLENFLSLRPYALLKGTRSDRRIQNMINNFNLLSRHVVVSILKSHNPHVVTAHWITIGANLRNMKNFNSLKAIIAGLTNESIYRLRQSIWSKIDRTSTSNFKLLATIVDDVNNQIVLRQTQLIVEGTAKMSIEGDSFGTIPYLGTFLTDLNMIDARYPNFVPSPKDETAKLKLINFEKCAKQFEILTQVQLLQKNALASLNAVQRRNNFDDQTTLNRLKLDFSLNQQLLAAKSAIPKVSPWFEAWFYNDNTISMTDKQCYEISLSIEQNTVQR